ncbi:MAG TPA: Gfo/Idh/MocA family oxidoreductase [Planctomycetota bacterium]|jgi:predicted dehydrogenase|nr:Gfo/Idh/MocA family oxidoreductase [Planctomycetota bacterium]OQC21660.1 MAG: Glucose--fructose oxidoreductase precursor [Planctomycetes bacterium ADurb.Bin069]NMD34545.1 Gfo/Idh/MocA family oxidoreductase [Planctomycetota bacterium]HNS00553.1 Gfo/Idh/MocA family oxidoreductase [Planctomycetota bacterium]HNU26465.1 Gfo/Idh/MocA family oxidoreductase [Planctomycetota bacterium]
MARLWSRRRFLAGSGAAGLAAIAFPRIARGLGANDKLAVACVGVGGMGWTDLHAVARSPRVSIAALCDIDAERLARAARAFPGARTYVDWRELFAKDGAAVDAVAIATPDHMHAPIAMTALRAGKHVYCQKPLAHDVYEARRLAAAAAGAKAVTQMGIQHSSRSANRGAVQLIHEGAIGKVREVHLWSNKPPERYRPTGPRPAAVDPVPAGVAWDLWLGTAPARPFAADTYHPTWWRGWQDFGTGWLGDMGCHIWAAPYMALRLQAPLSVKAQVEPAWAAAPARRSETWPTWEIVQYEFPGTDLTAGKTIKIVWSDGGKYPRRRVKLVLGGKDFPTQGALFLGEDGALLLPHGGDAKLLPEKKFKDRGMPAPPPADHYLAWVDACRGGGATIAPFERSGPLAEIVLLGTVALRCPGETLLWDGPAMQVTNIADANAFLKRSYRAGWEVEGL